MPHFPVFCWGIVSQLELQDLLNKFITTVEHSKHENYLLIIRYKTHTHMSLLVHCVGEIAREMLLQARTYAYLPGRVF